MAAAQPPPFEIVDGPRTISWKAPLFHGWPTLAQCPNGELLLAFSGGRGRHVCPFGRVELKRSKDGGQTWLWPQVIADSAIDDRDAGLLCTSRGTLLLTSYTSLAYEADLARADATPGYLDELSHREWRAAHDRLTAEQRQSELGTWLWRSTDGGVTWSPRRPAPVNSPHGPVELTSGRLLYPGVALSSPSREVAVYASDDDGLSWQKLADVPIRRDDQPEHYRELHAVEAANGTILIHLRNHNPPHLGEMLQIASTDGGRTWSIPRSFGVWGLPSHLLRRRDGRLVMSYGDHPGTIGVQARVSSDHGTTWSAPLALRDQAASPDLGHPSTVELANGLLVTVWYEVLPGSPNAQLRQVRWRLRDTP